MTVPEAAKRIGVNVKTLRKHVKMGRILAVDTPLGLRIAEEALLAYGPLRTTLDQPTEDQEEPEQTIVDQPGQTTSDHVAPMETTGVPLAAHLAALDFAERRIAEERQRLEEARLKLEQAQHRADQAERSRLAMEWQLQKYQLVLAESAESLAEEKAMRQQAEAKLQAELEREVVALDNLKVATPTPAARKGWGQRLRGWFGLKESTG